MSDLDTEAVLAQLNDTITKAVTNTTYTMSPPSRSIYSPENLDPTIKHVIPLKAPVRNVLPRSKGFGQVATWRKLTSRLDPQAAGTGTRAGFADAGQPAQTSQTYVLATAAYKNLGRDVELGRQALASNRGSNLDDLRTHEEFIKSVEVILDEEDTILNGDVSVTALEFDGFAKSFTTNSGTAGYVTSSGIGSYAQTLFNAGAEMPTHFVASPRQQRALADDLQGSGSIQRIVVDSQGSATGGVRLEQIVNPVSGNLIQVVASRYAGSWAYLLTVTDATGQNFLEMEDLEPLSVYDVPTANHSIVSRVYETTVLKVIAENFQYKIGGLSTT
jgi:hypothetical protein